MLLCIIAEEVLAIFIDVSTSIKGIQIGDYEIKKVNISDYTTILFRDFSCLIKIQLILETPKKSPLITHKTFEFNSDFNVK